MACVTCSKSRDGLLAHALRRRIGRNQLRVLLFQVAQFAQQRIVLLIADFRLGFSVVQVIVPANPLAQRFDPRRGGGLVGLSAAHRPRLARVGPAAW